MANKKCLIMFLDYIKENKKQTPFLTNVQISVANAEVITNTVKEQLHIHNIRLDKLYGMSTDGASIILGKKSGVTIRLREDVPTLVRVHCAAHRCALATSQASRAIPQLTNYSRTVEGIFHYIF